jgi:hypothetical protein
MIDAALKTMIDEVLISRGKMSETAVAPPAPRRHLIGLAGLFAGMRAADENESF